MKKIDLGQTITILANVGVIAGIVFLAVELSQNTESMQSQTAHSVQAEFREIYDFSPEFLQTTAKHRDEWTQEDLLVRSTRFMRIMRIYENQWYQYSRGYFDEGLFRAYQQHLRITLGVEDYAELWRIRKELGFFHPDFVSYVDSFTAENSPYTATETLVQ